MHSPSPPIGGLRIKKNSSFPPPSPVQSTGEMALFMTGKGRSQKHHPPPPPPSSFPSSLLGQGHTR